MRARASSCALIALLAGGVPAAHGADPEELAARAAHYYAPGLQAPLLQIRAGAAIVQTCKKKFRSRCTRRHREAADQARVTLEYLDALSLFPQRLASDPAAALTTYADVVSALDTLNDAILASGRDYDRALFVRYSVALAACPPDNLLQYRESLTALRQLDEQAFGPAASGGDDGTALAGTVAGLPPEECAATRDFGELLMTMMSAKLEPWRRDATAVPDAYAARSIASEFLFEVATELEVTVHPDSRGTFDAIAQRVHNRAPAAPKKPGLTLSW